MSEKRKPTILELESSHIDHVEWQTTGMPDHLIKMLSFRDGVAFFLTKMAPGASIRNREPFRQIQYIVEGEFIVNGKPYGPGTMIDLPDHTDYEVACREGGEFFVLQMAGSTQALPPDPRNSEALPNLAGE